ncbi:hypothetical protein STANM309S_04629 [Streptomyces tanashiensis]
MPTCLSATLKSQPAPTSLTLSRLCTGIGFSYGLVVLTDSKRATVVPLPSCPSPLWPQAKTASAVTATPCRAPAARCWTPSRRGISTGAVRLVRETLSPKASSPSRSWPYWLLPQPQTWLSLVFT